MLDEVVERAQEQACPLPMLARFNLIKFVGLLTGEGEDEAEPRDVKADFDSLGRGDLCKKAAIPEHVFELGRLELAYLFLVELKKVASSELHIRRELFFIEDRVVLGTHRNLPTVRMDSRNDRVAVIH